jgi:nicotinamide-nucleotide amidase
MEPTAETIYRSLGDLVFGEGDDGLEHAVTRLLRQRGKSLATVEWGTAGLVAEWLGDVADAEGFYLGGMIVTDEAALRRALHVPAELLVRHTALSREAAEAMAAGCRGQFAADFALAVGPFPKPDPDAPGPYYLALATPGGVRVQKLLYAGHPALRKILAAKHALNLARLELLKKG